MTFTSGLDTPGQQLAMRCLAPNSNSPEPITIRANCFDLRAPRSLAIRVKGSSAAARRTKLNGDYRFGHLASTPKACLASTSAYSAASPTVAHTLPYECREPFRRRQSSPNDLKSFLSFVFDVLLINVYHAGFIPRLTGPRAVPLFI